jgi:tetratricopeptide (TPR) repeat protein
MMNKQFLGAVSAAALLFLILGLVLLRSQTPSEEYDAGRIEANRQQGRPVQALYQIEALADAQGWTPERLRLAGDVWHEMGDVTQALPYWEAAGVGLPDDTLLARMLAESYLTLQRWTQAVDQLNRLVEMDFSDVWAHYQLGMLRAAFDPPTAETHLKLAVRAPEYQDVAATLLFVIDEYGTDPLIGMPVGLALADADQWPLAELAFQYAADVGQQYPEALAYVGLARDRQGKDSRAAIQQAVALGSQNAVVRFIQGLHLREQEDLAGSLDALVQAAVLDPDNPAYYAELGSAYRLLGDLENAEHWLREAVEISNQDPRFQQLLALFYAEEGPSLDADGLSELEAMATIVPDDPDVQAGLGWGLYRSGDVEAALEKLDAILDTVPQHPRSLYYKARIMLETGKLDEARTLLGQIIMLDSPFRSEAQRMLATVGGDH